MATILITHGVPAEGFYALKGHRVLIPAPLNAFSMEELAALIPEADAVVAGGKLPGDIIRRGKKLKIIANYGAGYDQVDVIAAAKCGIPVTNLPDTVTEDTAELAIGLMLAVSRRIGEMNLRLRREKGEALFGMGRYMGRSLHGLTLGILGCGRIGGRTAALAKGLGMRVVGFSRHGVDPAIAEPMEMEEMIASVDVLSLHCPLTPETRRLLNRERIAKMKMGAMVINTSRGGVVDHEALADALESGHLAGAGLDVFPEEPQVPERLLALHCVVATPHIGTNTKETRFRMAETCAAQILSAFNGKRPEHVVNGL